MAHCINLSSFNHNILCGPYEQLAALARLLVLEATQETLGLNSTGVPDTCVNSESCSHTELCAGQEPL